MIIYQYKKYSILRHALDAKPFCLWTISTRWRSCANLYQDLVFRIDFPPLYLLVVAVGNHSATFPGEKPQRLIVDGTRK